MREATIEAAPPPVDGSAVRAAAPSTTQPVATVGDLYVTFRRNVLLISHAWTNADMPAFPADAASVPLAEGSAARIVRG